MTIGTTTKRRLIILGGVLLAALTPLLIFSGQGGASTPYVETVDPFTYAGAATVVGGFLLFLGHAFIVYSAFQFNAAWGLVALVVPLGAIVFLFLNWRRCRDGIFYLLVGNAFLLLGLLSHPS